MSKKDSQKVHARKRAMERYGIRFTLEVRRNLVSQIQNRRAVFLDSRSNREKSFAVRYGDQWIPVVYDNKSQEIVTFLPPENLERYCGNLELIDVKVRGAP